MGAKDRMSCFRLNVVEGKQSEYRPVGRGSSVEVEAGDEYAENEGRTDLALMNTVVYAGSDRIDVRKHGGRGRDSYRLVRTPLTSGGVALLFVARNQRAGGWVLEKREKREFLVLERKRRDCKDQTEARSYMYKTRNYRIPHPSA